jgi:hypothetical protein
VEQHRPKKTKSNSLEQPSKAILFLYLKRADALVESLVKDCPTMTMIDGKLANKDLVNRDILLAIGQASGLYRA